MRVDVFGEILNALVESFRDGKLIEVVHELSQWFFVVIDHLGPSFFRRVFQVHFVSSGNVAVNRRKVRKDGRIDEGKAEECQADSK